MVLPFQLIFLLKHRLSCVQSSIFVFFYHHTSCKIKTRKEQQIVLILFHGGNCSFSIMHLMLCKTTCIIMIKHFRKFIIIQRSYNLRFIKPGLTVPLTYFLTYFCVWYAYNTHITCV